MKKNNYKKILSMMLFLSGIFFYGNFASAEALNLPKDSEGWTIFTPSDDSRIMYVSATGNDSTGMVYTNANHPDWENPQNPTGSINAFATYAAAFANVRDGYPDWILFKRGDTFTDSVSGTIGGRNISEPSFVGAYGSSGLSPLIKVDSTHIGLSIEPGSGAPVRRYMGFQGIRFYSYTRNPGDPGYTGYAGSNGLRIYSKHTSNVLFEGCAFIYFKNNFIQGQTGEEKISDVDVRRSLFLNSYDSIAHSQGLYGYLVDNILMEENIFDHNGWLIQGTGDNVADDGKANMFNHNTYFAASDNWTFKNNISARPSSIHNKHSGETSEVTNTIHDNNLYIDGEIGLDYAGNHANDLYPTPTANNLTYSNNILYKIGIGNNTNRNVSWAISLGGIGAEGGNIFNNMILNNGISIGMTAFNIGAPCLNTNIYDNIIYSSTGGGELWRYLEEEPGGINTHDNYFRSFAGTIGSYVYAKPGGLEGSTFTNNTWYGELIYKIPEGDYTEAQWQTNIDPTASFDQIDYTDDTRTVETYLTSIGEIGTLENFYALIRAQDMYNWDDRLMADAVNSYIRTGFDMGTDIIPPSAPHGLLVL